MLGAIQESDLNVGKIYKDLSIPLSRHLYGFGMEADLAAKCLLKISEANLLYEAEITTLDEEIRTLLGQVDRLMSYDGGSSYDLGGTLLNYGTNHRLFDDNLRAKEQIKYWREAQIQRHQDPAEQALLVSLIRIKGKLKADELDATRNQDDLVNCRARISELEKAVAEELNVIQTLRDSLADAHEKVEHADRKAEMVFVESAALRAELEQARIFCHALEDEKAAFLQSLANERREVNNLNSKIQELELFNTSVTAEIRARDELLCEQKVHIEELNRQIAITQQEKDAASLSVDDLQRRISAINDVHQATLKEMKKQQASDRLERNNHDIDHSKETSKLHQRIFELQNGIDCAKMKELSTLNEIQNLSAIVRSKDEIIDRLRADLQELIDSPSTRPHLQESVGSPTTRPHLQELMGSPTRQHLQELTSSPLTLLDPRELIENFPPTQSIVKVVSQFSCLPSSELTDTLMEMGNFTPRIYRTWPRVIVSNCIMKTAAGILIPERAQETLNRGEVIAVGPGSEKDKVTLKTGDIVILPAYGGSPVNLSDKNDDSMMLLRESEILAKVVDI